MEELVIKYTCWSGTNVGRRKDLLLLTDFLTYNPLSPKAGPEAKVSSRGKSCEVNVCCKGG